VCSSIKSQDRVGKTTNMHQPVQFGKSGARNGANWSYEGDERQEALRFDAL
jgi:hypothetical protein